MARCMELWKAELLWRVENFPKWWKCRFRIGIVRWASRLCSCSIFDMPKEDLILWDLPTTATDYLLKASMRYSCSWYLIHDSFVMKATIAIWSVYRLKLNCPSCSMSCPVSVSVLVHKTKWYHGFSFLAVWLSDPVEWYQAGFIDSYLFKTPLGGSSNSPS